MVVGQAFWFCFASRSARMLSAGEFDAVGIGERDGPRWPSALPTGLLGLREDEASLGLNCLRMPFITSLAEQALAVVLEPPAYRSRRQLAVARGSTVTEATRDAKEYSAAAWPITV